MILQKHWTQSEPISTLDIDYFQDDLSDMMLNFIKDGTYKNYYTNHVIIEVYKNIARLFNKNTEEYICIGFFNTHEDKKV